MKVALLPLVALFFLSAAPAMATTMPAFDRPGHALSLGSGGSQGAGLALDLAVAPRWKVGLEAGNANFYNVYAYWGVRGSYQLSNPGDRLQLAVTGGVWGNVFGPVYHDDGSTSLDSAQARYSLGLALAYELAPQWVIRANAPHISDFLRFDALPWNLLLPFYGQDTGVEVGYRLNPNLELTVGCNTAFNQLLGVTYLF